MNGRWIKSQRAVTFPLEDLDPARYTVQNGNGNRSSGSATPLTPLTETADPLSLKRSSRGEETPSGLLGDVRTPSPGHETFPYPAAAMTTPTVEQQEGCDGEECRLKVGGDAAGKGAGLSESGASGEGEEHVVNGTTLEGEEGEGGEGAKETTPGPDTRQSSTSDSPKLYNLFAISVSTILE